MAAVCGNGIVEPSEECESDHTPCLNCRCIAGYRGRGGQCETICGDGIVAGNEECEYDNLVEFNGCNANCTLPRCGNGLVDAGEVCDTGGQSATCNADCTAAVCGDGEVNATAGEQCDPPSAVCNSQCWSAVCGNGVVDAGSGEECDDGNTANGDGCDSNCTLPRCGNGVVDAGEECDDGNTFDADGCDSNCTKSRCGNGIVTWGEQCDPPGGDCNSLCRSAQCGNGILDAALGEECDDGNSKDGDGCDSNCMLTECGNGIVTAGEECDDGNRIDNDGCSNECVLNAICSSVLRTGCDTPTRKRVAIHLDPFKSGGRLRWTFEGGAVADFGNPLLFGNTQYALCIYDSSGPVYKGLALGGTRCGHAPCWRAAPAGFSYRDGSSAAAGVRVVSVRGKPRVHLVWVAQGANLAAPTLPLAPPVTVQLVSSEGPCWTTVFADPNWNTEFQFSGRR